MNGPVVSSVKDWFSPKPWVNDHGSSKIIAQFRACNIGLGNRGPAADGNFYKLCPLCDKTGLKALNNEVSDKYEKIINNNLFLFLRFIYYLNVQVWPRRGNFVTLKVLFLPPNIKNR